MRTILQWFLIGVCCLFFLNNSKAQNCITSLNGTTVNMQCNQNCTDLNFSIPHLKSSSDYTLVSIPYAPYPYVTLTGIEDFDLYDDDEYSNIFDLPFPFCFYDSLFYKAVIGSNGLITFEQAVAGCRNAYIIGSPIPFAGTFSCTNISSAYYPRASVMAAFSDLDPSTGPSPSDRKIQWELIGSAPCRKFVVSFYHIGVFGVNSGACPAPWNTFQMVFHESTGIIEIFYEQKLCASTTNAGRAIFGMQNWLRDKWISAPGKNNAVFTESQTGYRFTPSGGASRFVISELLDMSGNVIGTADTSTTTPGLLDIEFPNFCPPFSSTQFVVRTKYTACENAGVQLTILDTININRSNNFSATPSFTGATCNGAADGSITVTPAGGQGPYIFSLDGAPGIIQAGAHTFSNVSAGLHTVTVTDQNGCVASFDITIVTGPSMSTTVSKTDVLCNSGATGSITITPPTIGTAPHQYSLDGVTWQNGNIFSGLTAGTYTAFYRSANNCIGSTTVTINEPSALNATSVNIYGTCNGGADGVITVTANGGSPGYQYSIDGVNYQTSNVFNVLPSATYSVRVKDINGCIYSFNTFVGLTSDITISPQPDVTICEGTSTQLDLISNATQYSWTPSSGLSSTAIKNPVANPTSTTQYIVTATLGSCSLKDTVVINVNAAPVPNAGADGFICYGQTYQLQGSGGSQYSWSPATYLNDPSLPNPVSTPTKDVTYTLSIVSDANGCASLVTDQVVIDVTPPIKVRTFPYDTVAYAGDEFQVLAVPSDTDVTNYLWTPSIGLNDATIANPLVTAGAIGDVTIYKVTTSTIGGCKGEGFVTVRVYKGPDIYVPTGFTPNADGKNDKFTPFPVGMKSYKYFRVFNRWGQVIFSTTSLHVGWDGKLGGVDQPSGTYVWMIEGITKDGRTITKKGTVTLFR